MRRPVRLLAAAAAAASLAAAGLPALAAGTTRPASSGGVGATPAGCPARAPSATDLDLIAAGQPRSAYVVDPGSAGPAPVLVALHGWGGDGRRMAAYSGLARLAGSAGFIAVFPSSHGISWNIAADPHAADDVAFLRALIARVVRDDCGDPARVFVTGVSNGGGMAALAGCRLSGLVRAIAPVAGDYGPLPACRLAQPLSLLEIHGTADRAAGYFGRSGRRTADGLPAFVDAFAARDGCRAAPSVDGFARHVRRFIWRGCRAGSHVVHLQIRGGRHQWPGATPPDPGPPATFSAAAAIWQFFAESGP